MDNAGGCLVTRKTEHDYGASQLVFVIYFSL